MSVKSVDSIIGYVSKKGHGIKILYKNGDSVGKLRIFSNGKTSDVYISKKDDYLKISNLFEESYGFFKGILKKFSKPGFLSETDSKSIRQSYKDYYWKNGCHAVWSCPSGKPFFELSKETKAFIKMMDDAHKRALKVNIRYD